MVWVAATIGHSGSASRLVYEAFLRGDITIITSGPLVNEIAGTLIHTLHRPPDAVETFIAHLCARAEVLPIQHQTMGCLDQKDDPVLETAISGHADFIVTLDKRLLKLPQHVADYVQRHGVKIVSPGSFAPLLQKYIK
jgi:putative PIN family toxin of toxin-antitoxin system